MKNINQLKNIDCDYYYGYGFGVCCGDVWVATPFVLDYGYNHGYDNYVYVYEYDDNNYNIYNVFENEPTRFCEAENPSKVSKSIDLWTHEFAERFYKQKVIEFAKPRNYKLSIEVGDISHDISIDRSVYNYVTILLYKRRGRVKMRVAAAYISNTVTLDNMELMFDVPLDDIVVDKPVLITMQSNHFKHTVDLYKKNCYIRFLDGIKNSASQYNSIVRFDSGRSNDTNKYDCFSTVKTVTLDNATADKLIYLIPTLKIMR